MEFNPLTDYGQYDLKVPEHLLKWNFSELIKTLITLSVSPQRQVEIIGNTENPGEEMILDFESFYSLSSRKYIHAKLLQYDQAEALNELSDLLENVDDEGWSANGLYDRNYWEPVREKAKMILEGLDMQDLEIRIEKTQKMEEPDGGDKREVEVRRRVIVSR